MEVGPVGVQDLTTELESRIDRQVETGIAYRRIETTHQVRNSATLHVSGLLIGIVRFLTANHIACLVYNILPIKLLTRFRVYTSTLAKIELILVLADRPKIRSIDISFSAGSRHQIVGQREDLLLVRRSRQTHRPENIRILENIVIQFEFKTLVGQFTVVDHLGGNTGGQRLFCLEEQVARYTTIYVDATVETVPETEIYTEVHIEVRFPGQIGNTPPYLRQGELTVGFSQRPQVGVGIAGRIYRLVTGGTDRETQLEFIHPIDIVTDKVFLGNTPAGTCRPERTPLVVAESGRPIHTNRSGNVVLLIPVVVHTGEVGLHGRSPGISRRKTVRFNKVAQIDQSGNEHIDHGCIRHIDLVIVELMTYQGIQMMLAVVVRPVDGLVGIERQSRLTTLIQHTPYRNRTTFLAILEGLGILIDRLYAQGSACRKVLEELRLGVGRSGKVVQYRAVQVLLHIRQRVPSADQRVGALVDRRLGYRTGLAVTHIE